MTAAQRSTGIDKRLLQSELYKHWGLLGMRERSAKLVLNSASGAGTEVELSVPGRVAFGGERPSAA